TIAVRHRRPGLALSESARRAIVSYGWPGNVRELANALERMTVLARDATLRAEDLPDQVSAPTPPLAAPQGSLEDVERQHVRRVLAESATLEEAAARLGINPTTLWRKRRRWGLD